MTETIKNLTALNLRNLTLDSEVSLIRRQSVFNDNFSEMLPVLRQAVGAFSTLKDQIGTLVRFFGVSVAHSPPYLAFIIVPTLVYIRIDRRCDAANCERPLAGE